MFTASISLGVRARYCWPFIEGVITRQNQRLMIGQIKGNKRVNTWACAQSEARCNLIYIGDWRPAEKQQLSRQPEIKH